MVGLLFACSAVCVSSQTNSLCLTGAEAFRSCARSLQFRKGADVLKNAAIPTKQKPTSPPCRSDPEGASLSTLSLPDTPFPNPLAICEDGPDGWTLLVNPDTAAAIAVNPTGALIWRLANGRRTVAEIVAGVRRRFPKAPGSADGDVAALLATLSKAGLIGEEIRADVLR